MIIPFKTLKYENGVFFKIPIPLLDLPSTDPFISLLETKGCSLCGGALLSGFLGTKIHDYDIYFKREEDIHLIRAFLQVYAKAIFSSSTNAISYSYKLKTESPEYITIQLIKSEKFMKNSIEDLLKTFDFTCCMIGYDFNTKSIKAHRDFFEIIKQKTLVYNIDTTSKHTIIRRLGKYIRKGFNISYGEITKILVSLLEQNLISKNKEDSLTIQKRIKLIKSLLLMGEYERCLSLKQLESKASNEELDY